MRRLILAAFIAVTLTTAAHAQQTTSRVDSVSTPAQPPAHEPDQGEAPADETEQPPPSEQQQRMQQMLEQMRQQRQQQMQQMQGRGNLGAFQGRFPSQMRRPTRDSAAPGYANVVNTAEGYRFDFQDADIKSVITALAAAGQLNVVYGDLPPRKVSLRMNRPVPANEIAPVLRNVAMANGLKVMEDNGIITVSTTAQPQQNRQGPNFEGTELHVYRLKHANATELSSLLQGIFTAGGTRFAGAGTSAQQRNNRTSARTRGMSGSNGGLGGTGGANNSSLGGGVSFTLGGTGGGRGGGGGGNFGGGNGNVFTTPGAIQSRMIQGMQAFAAMAGMENTAIVIAPDEMTNSLLIRATPEDWLVIKQAIEAVDLRPMQVVIEVMIAEVQRNDDLEFGVSGNASNARTSTNGTVASGKLGPAPDSSDNFIMNLSRRGAVDINIAIKALQTRGTVRVLSLPLVFAQNNKESSLIVGTQRPFIQSYQTGLTDNGVQNQVVQYREVGTVLDIVPTINPDGYVNLDVYQEVSSATTEVQFGAPVISTRQASATVFVRDGQTVVVGGLTDRQGQDVRQGIPLLSAIPWLGALFGTTTHISQRTELYLFLTPHIVMTDEDAEHVRQEVGKNSQLMHAIPADSVRVIDPQYNPLSNPRPLTTPDSTLIPLPNTAPAAPATPVTPAAPPTSEPVQPPAQPGSGSPPAAPPATEPSRQQ
jgi:general secretion pathway protein D